MSSWLSAKISALGERVMDSVLDAVVQNQDVHIKNLQNMQQWNISRLVNRVVNAKYFYKQNNVESSPDFDALFPPSFSPVPVSRASSAQSGCAAQPRDASSSAASLFVPQGPIGRLEICVGSCSLVLFTAEGGRVLPHVAMLQRQQQHQQLLWQTVIHVENQEQRSPCYKMEQRDAYSTNEILFNDSYEFPVRDLWTDICINVFALKTKRHIIIHPSSSSPGAAGASVSSSCRHSSHHHSSRHSRSRASPAGGASASSAESSAGATGGLAGDAGALGSSTDASLGASAPAGAGNRERSDGAGRAAGQDDGERGLEAGACSVDSCRGSRMYSPSPPSDSPPTSRHSSHATLSHSSLSPSGVPKASTLPAASSSSSSREGRYLYGRAIVPLSAFLSSTPPQWEAHERRGEPASRHRRESLLWRGVQSVRERMWGRSERGEKLRKADDAGDSEERRVSRAEFWVQLFPDNNKLSERKFLKPVKGFEEFGMKNPLSTLGFLRVAVAFEWLHEPAVSPLLSCLLPPSHLWVVPLKPEPHFVESFSRRCKDVLEEPPRWIDLFFHFGGHLADRTWSGSACWFLFWINLFYLTCLAPLWQVPACVFLAVGFISFSYFLLRQNRFFRGAAAHLARATVPLAAPPLSFHTPTWAAPVSPSFSLLLPSASPSLSASASLASCSAPACLLASGSSSSGTPAFSAGAAAPPAPPEASPFFRYKDKRDKSSRSLVAPLGDCPEGSDWEEGFSDDAAWPQAFKEANRADQGRAWPPRPRRGSSCSVMGEGEETRENRPPARRRLALAVDRPLRDAEGKEDLEADAAEARDARRRRNCLEKPPDAADAAILAALGLSSLRSSFSFSGAEPVAKRPAENPRGDDEPDSRQSLDYFFAGSEGAETKRNDRDSPLQGAAPAPPAAFAPREEDSVVLGGRWEDSEKGEGCSAAAQRAGRVSKVSSPFGDITLFVRESTKGEEGRGLASDETWPVFADDEAEPLVQEQLNKLIELATGLQIATGYLSSVTEKLRYAFNWEDPFLSFASLLLLFVHALLWSLLLYGATFVPLIVFRVLLFVGFLLFGFVTDPRVQARVDEKLKRELSRRSETEKASQAALGGADVAGSDAIADGRPHQNLDARNAAALPCAETEDSCGRLSSASSTGSCSLPFGSAAAGGFDARADGAEGDDGARAVGATPEDGERDAGESGYSARGGRDKKEQPANLRGLTPSSWLASLVGPASPFLPSKDSTAPAAAADVSSSAGLGASPIWNLVDVSAILRRRGPPSARAVTLGRRQSASSASLPQATRDGEEKRRPSLASQFAATDKSYSCTDVTDPADAAPPVERRASSPLPVSHLSLLSSFESSAGASSPSAERVGLLTFLAEDTQSRCRALASILSALLPSFLFANASPLATCLDALEGGAQRLSAFMQAALFCPLLRALESAVATYFSLLYFWWMRLPDRREIEHRLIASTQVVSSLHALVPAASSAPASRRVAAPAPVFAATSPPSAMATRSLFSVDSLLFAPARRLALAHAAPAAAGGAAPDVREYLDNYFQQRWEKENPLTASVYAAAPYLLPAAQKKGTKTSAKSEEKDVFARDLPRKREKPEALTVRAREVKLAGAAFGSTLDKEAVIARATSGGYAPEVALFASNLSPQELQKWQQAQARRVSDRPRSRPTSQRGSASGSRSSSPHSLGSSWARPESRKETEPDGESRDARRSSAAFASRARAATKDRDSARERERGDKRERYVGPVISLGGEDIAIVTHRRPPPARGPRPTGAPSASFAPGAIDGGDGEQREAERPADEKQTQDAASKLVRGLHLADFPAFDIFFGRTRKASRDSDVSLDAQVDDEGNSAAQREPGGR
ncbi:hypothetical protein BESB_068690 [Besnoitia besnoiti]|uniref:Transmembrane protein n=1 Tax=Besnoitia besnoiti TaxID=94643 RepID=A0A2A9MFS9_BESBE|nr:hypothetical protein BESB_068690 [Besnoitia besnoiti]PFH34836.1 hypothetical protein BESB_068690 [Besnoitia besnoiti]